MAASDSFCGLGNDGFVRCAGIGDSAQPPPVSLLPGPPTGMVVEIAAGPSYGYENGVQCLRLAGSPLTGRIWCWGDDGYGALGAGATEDLRAYTDAGITKVAWRCPPRRHRPTRCWRTAP